VLIEKFDTQWKRKNILHLIYNYKKIVFRFVQNNNSIKDFKIPTRCLLSYAGFS
jgi:hypothetical protein